MSIRMFQFFTVFHSLTDKFKSGSYILYQDVDYLNVTDQQIDKSQKIHAGDVLDLSFYDDVTETYQTKSLTVMAVITRMDNYGTGNICYGNIVMPDTLFQSIYPNYDKRISGISNMVNTLITDTLTQKKEILIFQAVGMTKKQLWRFLFKNSLRLCFISGGIMLAAGSYLTVTVASSSMFTGFNLTLFGLNFLLLLCFMAALCATISSIMHRQLNKKSVVERLRAFE